MFVCNTNMHHACRCIDVYAYIFITCCPPYFVALGTLLFKRVSQM